MPVRYPDYSGIDGSFICIRGVLVKTETKIKDSEKSLICYVRDPVLEAASVKLCSSHRDMVICYMKDVRDVPPLGSYVTLEGRARCFSSPTNPGMFDYAGYYSVMNIGFSMTDSDIISADNSGITAYWRLKASLNSFRDNVALMCDLTFPGEDAGILRGILLGDKSALDAETRSMYSRNGIAHILAISGLHISMLGTGIAALLKKIRVPAVISDISVMVLMILYGIMTGLAASAFRAIIMFSLRMTADIIHRTYDMATALVVAAVMILSVQPEYIFYSGFQFSFGAIAAILLIAPVLEDVMPRIIAGGLSINAFTLPVYLHNYYYYPLLSMLINLYIIPLMSLLLGVSVLSLAACAIFIPLGRLMGLVSHLILMIYEYSCRLCDLVSWNRYVTGKPGIMSTIIYVVILAIVIIFHHKMTRLQILMNLAVAGGILTLSLHAGISVTLVDVGQGDGIYITDNMGTDIMIDGGSTSVRNVGKDRISPFLFSQGTASLDAVFITHLDADHYNGILELMEDDGKNTPRIDNLFLTSSAKAGNSPAYREIISAASEASIPVHIITGGDVYEKGALRLKCLYPDPECSGADTNAESLVMHLCYGRIHMLFTGDLEAYGEEALDLKLPEEIRPEDTLILKVAHHGSRYSSEDRFLELSGPDIALISAGKNNSYGHPHEELTKRLDLRDIPWFSTSDHGAIRVDILKDDVKVTGFTDR